MANVTYLLGAGASYNALPVVNEIPDAINGVIGELSRRLNGPNLDLKNLYSQTDRKTALKNAIENLKELKKGTENHLSIDTYAKMLFLTKNKSYELAKYTISLFFQLYQQCKINIDTNNTNQSWYRPHKILDNRYDAFLASILVDSYDKFPNNINVLSYNYDDQFERAYSNYLNHANAEDRIFELMNIYRRNEDTTNFDTNGFSFFKVNGTVGHFNNDNTLIDPYNFISNREDAIIDVLLKYDEIVNNINNFKSGISFAWDSPDSTKTMISTIRKAVENTQVLVVIGYSFPYFNKEIDDQIIKSMSKLYKIYIQNPTPNNNKERLYAILPNLKRATYQDSIVEIQDTKQFYLPEEL